MSLPAKFLQKVATAEVVRSTSPDAIQSPRPAPAPGFADGRRTVFSPGEHLPLWAVHALATWPGLHPAWWADEGFQMAAQAIGVSGATIAPPDPDPGAREAWEAQAARILKMDILLEAPGVSQVRSWQYGLRLYHSDICKRALARLEASGAKPIDKLTP